MYAVRKTGFLLYFPPGLARSGRVRLRAIDSPPQVRGGQKPFSHHLLLCVPRPCNHNHRRMKRFLQSSPHELHMLETFDLPCLKRLRLSTSPGELRLERDLHHLPMHWTRVNNCRWESRHGMVVLERKRDPMTFSLQTDQNSQVWIEISRSYPHEPPVITHVHHPYVCDVIVTLEPAMNSIMTIHSDKTIVYDKWSPVRQLTDLLDYLVVALLSRQTHRNVQTPTLLSDEDMQEEPKTILDLQRELSPNRFDLGYPKSNNAAINKYLF